MGAGKVTPIAALPFGQPLKACGYCGSYRCGCGANWRAEDERENAVYESIKQRAGEMEALRLKLQTLRRSKRRDDEEFL